MRVRIVRPVSMVEGLTPSPGDVVEVSDRAAALLIANGEAVDAAGETVEAASVAPTEAAARKPARTRKPKG